MSALLSPVVAGAGDDGPAQHPNQGRDPGHDQGVFARQPVDDPAAAAAAAAAAAVAASRPCGPPFFGGYQDNPSELMAAAPSHMLPSRPAPAFATPIYPSQQHHQHHHHQPPPPDMLPQLPSSAVYAYQPHYAPPLGSSPVLVGPHSSSITPPAAAAPPPPTLEPLSSVSASPTPVQCRPPPSPSSATPVSSTTSSTPASALDPSAAAAAAAAAPGPIPATTPQVVRQDSNGVQWIAFEYSRDRVKIKYTIRCDVESVDVESLSPDFKTENCVYPRACCAKDQYRGNRLVYETECNAVGWALAHLNDFLRGRRGLIQRAVDSWRNSNQDPRLRSRRVRRQAKVTTRRASHPVISVSPHQHQQLPQAIPSALPVPPSSSLPSLPPVPPVPSMSMPPMPAMSLPLPLSTPSMPSSAVPHSLPPTLSQQHQHHHQQQQHHHQQQQQHQQQHQQQQQQLPPALSVLPSHPHHTPPHPHHTLTNPVELGAPVSIPSPIGLGFPPGPPPLPHTAAAASAHVHGPGHLQGHHSVHPPAHVHPPPAAHPHAPTHEHAAMQMHPYRHFGHGAGAANPGAGGPGPGEGGGMMFGPM